MYKLCPSNICTLLVKDFTALFYKVRTLKFKGCFSSAISHGSGSLEVQLNRVKRSSLFAMNGTFQITVSTFFGFCFFVGLQCHLQDFVCVCIVFYSMQTLKFNGCFFSAISHGSRSLEVQLNSVKRSSLFAIIGRFQITVSTF